MEVLSQQPLSGWREGIASSKALVNRQLINLLIMPLICSYEGYYSGRDSLRWYCLSHSVFAMPYHITRVRGALPVPSLISFAPYQLV